MNSINKFDLIFTFKMNLMNCNRNQSYACCCSLQFDLLESCSDSCSVQLLFLSKNTGPVNVIIQILFELLSFNTNFLQNSCHRKIVFSFLLKIGSMGKTSTSTSQNFKYIAECVSLGVSSILNFELKKKQEVFTQSKLNNFFFEKHGICMIRFE